MVEAHAGGVSSVLVMDDGTMFSGGRKDGKVIQWDDSYAPTGFEIEVGLSCKFMYISTFFYNTSNIF